jgi:hypothetical protein
MGAALTTPMVGNGRECLVQERTVKIVSNVDKPLSMYE